MFFIIDIVIVLLIIIGAIVGYKKGLSDILINIVGVILALILAFTFKGAVAEFLDNTTGIGTTLKATVSDGIAEAASEKLNINIKKGRIICEDVFDPYCDSLDRYKSHYPSDLDSLASEMESFALFYMAKKFNKNAACLLTITDSKYENNKLTSEDREKSLDEMIILALEAAIKED